MSVGYLKSVLSDLVQDVQLLGRPERALGQQKFFKTGPGDYSEHDIFIGVSVPELRKLGREYYARLSLADIEHLLKSEIHELRCVALIILCKQFQLGDKVIRRRIFDGYLRNIDRVNNWDLVDISAPIIVGGFLYGGKDRALLYKFAKSKQLWLRRISIISTLFFIRKGDFEDTLQVAKILLADSEDLIHKAVGWMLREVGKRNKAELRRFLVLHGAVMPRVMLRYSIEKMTTAERKRFLAIKKVV